MMKSGAVPKIRKEFGSCEGVLGSSCGTRWAVAQLPTLKDEDRYAVQAFFVEGVADAAFAVYDGHGGATASSVCANMMMNHVRMAIGSSTQVNGSSSPGGNSKIADPLNHSEAEKLGPWHPKLDQALKDAFNQMDSQIKSRVMDGTTATVVLLKRDEEGKVHIKCAWVGDSRALLLRDGKSVEPLSIDHNPTNEAEAKRMREFKREESQKKEQEQQQQKKDEQTENKRREPVKQKVVNKNSFRIVPDHLDKVALRDSPEVTPETSVHGEDQYTIFDIAQLAQRSFIGKFVDPRTGMSGCKRIFSTNMGSSLAVSRSIGDEGSARCVIAEPEIINVMLNPGEKGRIMIASDGVWDVMSNKKALECWYPRDPLAACKSIAESAFVTRQYTGYSADDITILLVDVHRSDKTRRKKYTSGSTGGSNYDSETSAHGGGSVYSGMSEGSQGKASSPPPLQAQACCTIQ